MFLLSFLASSLPFSLFPSLSLITTKSNHRNSHSHNPSSSILVSSGLSSLSLMGISPATTGDSSNLLELAASDDLVSFQRAVEVEKVPVDVPAAWYGRWSSSSPKFELRTPLMIASLYGSVSVVQYILSNPCCSGDFDVSRRCGSDSSTALHLAVAGGSDGSAKVVKLLLDAGADVNAVDSGGNKAVDLIPRRKPSLWGKTTSTVEFCLGDGVCSLKEEDEKEEEVGSPATPKQNLVSPGGEKKEYPVDVTLPDINTGIYGTDDFRMYTFKVKPCSRAYSHDWTECPFVHPGENARRRDPRKYHYSCVPCPDFRKGSCRNGDACEYAHGVFESWLHPAQYRTRLCKDEIGCNRRVCFFAHKPEELRPLYNSSGSPGSVASSPRSTVNLPPLDLNAAAAAILMNQAPMSPSSSAALAAAVWLNQNTGGAMTTPTSQLQSSRLKSSLSARDMDLELELLALDAYHHQQQLLKQQKLIEEIGGDLYSSPDTTLMSPLKNLSLMKQSAAVSQFSSPSALQKQLLSAYSTAGGKPRSSPPVPRSSSPSFGVDNNSIPSALINSRASAFAKRSQSFIDRGALNRQPINSQITPTNNSPSPGFSDWGSPSGILDWKIHGEELNKLRKSASFGIRANGTSIGGGAPGFSVPAVSEDPDLSWTQSIGKRYDVSHQIHHQQQQQQQQQQEKIMMMMKKKQQQFNLNSSADEFHPGDIFASSWSDQLRFDQENLVA